MRLDGLNRELGMPGLWLKCEHVQPTASFKDRLHAVSMTVARTPASASRSAHARPAIPPPTTAAVRGTLTGPPPAPGAKHATR